MHNYRLYVCAQCGVTTLNHRCYACSKKTAPKKRFRKAVPKSGSEKWFGNAGANAVVQSGEAVRAQEIQIGCQQYNTECHTE
jgi:hypothetical protein